MFSNAELVHHLWRDVGNDLRESQRPHSSSSFGSSSSDVSINLTELLSCIFSLFSSYCSSSDHRSSFKKTVVLLSFSLSIFWELLSLYALANFVFWKNLAVCIFTLVQTYFFISQEFSSQQAKSKLFSSEPTPKPPRSNTPTEIITRQGKSDVVIVRLCLLVMFSLVNFSLSFMERYVRTFEQFSYPSICFM